MQNQRPLQSDEFKKGRELLKKHLGSTADDILTQVLNLFKKSDGQLDLSLVNEKALATHPIWIGTTGNVGLLKIIKEANLNKNFKSEFDAILLQINNQVKAKNSADNLYLEIVSQNEIERLKKEELAGSPVLSKILLDSKMLPINIKKIFNDEMNLANKQAALNEFIKRMQGSSKKADQIDRGKYPGDPDSIKAALKNFGISDDKALKELLAENKKHAKEKAEYKKIIQGVGETVKQKEAIKQANINDFNTQFESLKKLLSQWAKTPNKPLPVFVKQKHLRTFMHEILTNPSSSVERDAALLQANFWDRLIAGNREEYFQKKYKQLYQDKSDKFLEQFFSSGHVNATESKNIQDQTSPNTVFKTSLFNYLNQSQQFHSMDKALSVLEKKWKTVVREMNLLIPYLEAKETNENKEYKRRIMTLGMKQDDEFSVAFNSVSFVFNRNPLPNWIKQEDVINLSRLSPTYGDRLLRFPQTIARVLDGDGSEKQKEIGTIFALNKIAQIDKEIAKKSDPNLIKLRDAWLTEMRKREISEVITPPKKVEPQKATGFIAWLKNIWQKISNYFSKPKSTLVITKKTAQTSSEIELTSYPPTSTSNTFSRLSQSKQEAVQQAQTTLNDLRQKNIEKQKSGRTDEVLAHKELLEKNKSKSDSGRTFDVFFTQIEMILREVAPSNEIAIKRLEDLKDRLIKFRELCKDDPVKIAQINVYEEKINAKLGIKVEHEEKHPLKR